jgi:hypothetical protein
MAEVCTVRQVAAVLEETIVPSANLREVPTVPNLQKVWEHN